MEGGGIFKRNGNEHCLLCDIETATEFERPLVRRKATTDQSPAIAVPRANIGRDCRSSCPVGISI